MHNCVCVCVCVCARVYVSIHVCMYVCVCASTWTLFSLQVICFYWTSQDSGSAVCSSTEGSPPPLPREREEHQREREGGGTGGGGARGYCREDTEVVMREGERKQGGGREDEGRGEAHLYAGYCVPLV